MYCLAIYAHIYIYIYTHICIYTHIHIHMHIHIHIHTLDATNEIGTPDPKPQLEPQINQFRQM